MHRALVGSLLLIVTGCASTADIREKPVAASFESTRSVADLSNCLAGVLSQPKGAMIRTTPITNGVVLAESISVSGLMTVTNVTEIEDKGAVRAVTLRSVAKYKPRDVERVTAAYAPCLRD